MLRKLVAMAACSALLVLAKAPERPLRVVTTQQLDFTAGTVRIDNAYGELNVEGWDEPRVEITVTRTAFRHNTPREQEEGKAYLNRIQVTARKTNGDVEITTQFPGRNRLVRLIHGLGDFTLDYRIKVPRNAKLAIRHGVGDVMLLNLAGDIDALVRAGDLVVQVPDPEKYAIDAQCRIGGVYSDFDGAHRSPYLVGQKLEGGTGHALHLRVLTGGISIQRTATPTPLPAAPAF